MPAVAGFYSPSSGIPRNLLVYRPQSVSPGIMPTNIFTIISIIPALRKFFIERGVFGADSTREGGQVSDNRSVK